VSTIAAVLVILGTYVLIALCILAAFLVARRWRNK
jgi:hypothetical protein